MRLLCTITSKHPDEDPYAFSAYLKQAGIDNECEEVSLPQELPIYRIWVIQEEHFPRAQRLYEQFQAQPKDSRFLAPIEALKQEPDEKKESNNGGFLSPSPYGKLSIFVIALCVFLFVWSQMKRPASMVPPSIPNVVEAPVFSPIEKAFLFDYPHYFELRDELLKDPKQLQTPIIQEMQKTPFWVGAYDRVVNHLKKSDFPLAYHGPMFEKISQGQFWRLLTPAFLHFNLLHIFFNLLWFIVLGNQIEFRIGFWRFLILIVSTAVFSNIGQYLMSGTFFLGLSGVVCGLVGFIYARQQVAFWEGYLLNKTTFIFLFAFIFGMLALQLALFFIQVFTKYSVNLVIANTAHIVGGVVGYLLGRMHFFSIKRLRKSTEP